MISALFVDDGGPYFDREGLDPWGISRDARNYQGPNRVIAHPPCERWGRYWSGGPNGGKRFLLGDDKGCFAAALWAVRTFGGVVEHPEASHAWRWFGLPRPDRFGGWTKLDSFAGRSCCVEQGHYGHSARKATWLYACRCGLYDFIWGPSNAKGKLDPGYHSKAEARIARDKLDYSPVKRLNSKQRIHTPELFIQALMALVCS